MKRGWCIGALVVTVASVSTEARAQDEPQASPAPAPAPAPAPSERKGVTTLGIGPTVFAAMPTNDARALTRAGAALSLAHRIPIGEDAGIGLRFAWGLTEWDRIKDFTRPGYKIGSWTTGAYEDVWQWAVEKDDFVLFKVIGAVFASAVLIVPLVVAGVCYLAAPFAPTTYLEFDVTGQYDFSNDKVTPYLKGGVGLMAYVHPDAGKLLGGVGPTAGGGIRIEGLDLGVNVTWLPAFAHGEAGGERSHVIVGTANIGVNF